MTEPVTPWAEHYRNEWASLELDAIRRLPLHQRAARYERGHLDGRFTVNQIRAAEDLAVLDELRPPETDEEPWDVLEAAVVGTAWWVTAVTAVILALTVVLALLGLRSLLGRNGS